MKSKVNTNLFQYCKLEYGLAMVASLTDSSLLGTVVYQMVTCTTIYSGHGHVNR